MKLQQADLPGSEKTPIADVMRSVGAEYVTRVTQADFNGSQAIGLDGYFPQLRSVITQDHEKFALMTLPARRDIAETQFQAAQLRAIEATLRLTADAANIGEPLRLKSSCRFSMKRASRRKPGRTSRGHLASRAR